MTQINQPGLFIHYLDHSHFQRGNVSACFAQPILCVQVNKPPVVFLEKELDRKSFKNSDIIYNKFDNIQEISFNIIKNTKYRRQIFSSYEI